LSDIKSWAEWFEKRAEYYDNPLLKMAYYIGGQPVPDDVMACTIDDVWKKLRAGASDELLDVGGGVGLFSQAYTPRIKRAVTTDISFSMIRGGLKINPAGEYIVCDAALLPFASSTFDRLLCYSVFHYLRDLDHAACVVREFVRVVKCGGAILIGDVPKKVLEQPKAKRSTAQGKAVHFPSSLKHDLRQMSYEPEFFVSLCREMGAGCDILDQDIKGKITSNCRFDVYVKADK